MLTPMMRALAADGDFDLLSRRWGHDLFSEQPFVARCFWMRKPNRRGGALARLFLGGERRRIARLLSARLYDEIVLFARERQVVVDWIEGWKGPARIRVCEYSPGPGRLSLTYASEQALRSGGFAMERLTHVPSLVVSDPSRERAHQALVELGERVVFLHPGSARTRKRFRSRPHLKGLPPAQWADFASWLLSSGECDAIAVSGGAPEHREARAIRRLVPDPFQSRVHDVTGRIPLRDLPAYLACASALVSVDTGPAHVAAAVGCPLIDLFGPTDPSIYLPRSDSPVVPVLGSAPCQFCHDTPLYKTCRDNVCLRTLPPEALRKAWTELRRLSAGAPEGRNLTGGGPPAAG